MNSLVKKVFLGLSIMLLVGAPLCSRAGASGTETFVLEGLEIAKGIDIGTIRIGTSFAGRVLDEGGSEQGFWSATLSHRGASNIEVCGGTNDIVSLRMVVCFTQGPRSGKQLILGMVDLRRNEDVFWDYNYSGPPCELGGFGCDPCSPDADRGDCEPGGRSDLAVIPQLDLLPYKGSTLKVLGASLKNGLLCHYFPIIPRVFGNLELVF